ncbi:ChaB family protein [Methanobacterium sp.]|uniref:ChaB family protein n=1 Tax=Methanobacterium sp. TaxID=2164 RepID=UPI003C788598
MPYKNKEDLPAQVKENLPEHAQEIYLKAFNNAWDQYKEPEERRGKESREETSHKVAWAAVKQKYKKGSSGKWEEK